MKQFRKSDFSAEELNRIRTELTFCHPQSTSKKFPVNTPPYHGFAENEQYLRVPKFYKQPASVCAPSPRPFDFHPRLSPGRPAAFSIDFLGDSPGEPLRPLQKEAVEIISARLSRATPQSPRGALLCIPCGFGKTRCAIFVLQRIGTVTLVLTANKQLGVQFRRAIHSLSSDVVTAMLPKPDRPLPEAHVIFGTLQSVYSRAYPACYLAPIGMLVVDEAHHIAAPTFAQAMCKLPMARVLALTATPERQDGRENLIYYLAGNTAFRHIRPRVAGLCVRFLRYAGSGGLATHYQSLSERMQFLVRLCGWERRNAVLAAAIVEFFRRSGATARGGIIVLSKLVEHLHGLARLCVDQCPELDHGFFTGAESLETRDVSAGRRVIFATYDMAKEGLDIPRLDTLVLASPAESLTQCVGRILRDFPDKNSPVVVDMNDDCVAFRHEVASRRRKFESMGATIT
jgi:superfamily II DNA or RNA helicase